MLLNRRENSELHALFFVIKAEEEMALLSKQKPGNKRVFESFSIEFLLLGITTKQRETTRGFLLQ
jgi:hypothetical protein